MPMWFAHAFGRRRMNIQYVTPLITAHRKKTCGAYHRTTDQFPFLLHTAPSVGHRFGLCFSTAKSDTRRRVLDSIAERPLRSMKYKRETTGNSDHWQLNFIIGSCACGRIDWEPPTHALSKLNVYVYKWTNEQFNNSIASPHSPPIAPIDHFSAIRPRTAWRLQSVRGSDFSLWATAAVLHICTTSGLQIWIRPPSSSEALSCMQYTITTRESIKVDDEESGVSVTAAYKLNWLGSDVVVQTRYLLLVQ